MQRLTISFLAATSLSCSITLTSFAAPDGWEWPYSGVSCFPGTPACAYVRELVSWDDGSGSALYVGGLFEYAGGKPANSIARWNGQSWSTLAEGVAGHLETMIPFDDGTGEVLFAAGDFGVYRWDGRSWMKSDEGLSFFLVQVFASFDDGSGPGLYAGGGGLAKWNGLKWTAVPGKPPGTIRAMAAFNDGVKPRLCVASNEFGGPMHIATWDGATWTEIGPPTGVHPFSFVWRMTSFKNGNGQKLFVSGEFFDETGKIPGMVSWDGEKWANASAGLATDFYARDFTIIKEGETPVLYAVGPPSAHRWDGQKWQALPPLDYGFAWAGAGFDEGGGERLHLGGQLQVNNNWTNIVRRKPSGGGGTPSCGDLTGDGFVNQQDLGVLLGDFGCTKGVGLCPGDCDMDGDTDQADLGILLGNWEKPCP